MVRKKRASPAQMRARANLRKAAKACKGKKATGFRACVRRMLKKKK